MQEVFAVPDGSGAGPGSQGRERAVEPPPGKGESHHNAREMPHETGWKTRRQNKEVRKKKKKKKKKKKGKYKLKGRSTTCTFMGVTVDFTHSPVQ